MRLARRLFGLFLGRRLPRTAGTLHAAGLRQVVTVARDEWGIPHIEAQNDRDAWFALGFCQAQDRGFQLESILRVSRGTLAELVGPRGVPIDRLVRRLGFRRSAAQQVDVISAEVREIAEAFAAGVNAGHAVGCRSKPHEFSLLGGRPTPWDAQDVLAYVKLQSFTLPSNWDAELARLQVLLRDGDEALKALDPSVRTLADDFAAFRAMFPAGGGSNNWTISGKRTASGRPLVCNDPHLFPSLPSQWYLAHLRTPDWAVAGAAFAGGPGFAAGFNGHVAWGCTAGLTDNSDIFVEHLSPDGRRAKQGDGWVDCMVRSETIHVRGGKPIVEEMIETPRGPIISSALAGEWPALALRAVWLDPHPVQGFLTAVRAKTGEEFRRCFAEWPCLPLNLVYGDTSGAIGYQMVGNVPRRPRGHGSLPRPGWDESFAWDGLIPFDEMPHVAEPTEGFFATANNAPPGHGFDSPLGNGWMDAYRHDAICEALAEKTGSTVADCQKLQLDLRSLPWREVRDAVLEAVSKQPEWDKKPANQRGWSQIADYLRIWDGQLTPDSRQGAVFELVATDLMVQLAKAKAPNSHMWLLGETAWTPGINMFYLKRMGPLCLLLREQPPGWFDRPWSEVITESVVSALVQCKGKTWGDLHSLRPKSLLLGDRWPLRHIFSCGPIPFGGDTDTINQGSVDPMRPIGETDNIAGLRMTVDVGNWSASRFVLCGGQSGNPLSPHYDDLFELWQRGEGVPMPWTPEEIRAAARETLTIRPA